MAVDNETLLLRAYETFNARDIDGALALMDPDVEWPNGMEGGCVHGHDEVRAYWTRQWQMIDPGVMPLSFRLDTDGRTAVEVHQVVRDLSGAVISDRVVEHAYRIRDGRIEQMEIREP